jgi:hypothetical protein
VRSEHDRCFGGDENRREIAPDIVWQLRIRMRRDAEVAHGGEEIGIAVGGGLRDVIGGHGAASAGAVLDDDLLLPQLAELGADQAGRDVDDTAGRVRRDEANRP